MVDSEINTTEPPEHENEGHVSPDESGGSSGLVREFYAQLFRLGLAVSDSPEAARAAAIAALAVAQRNHDLISSGGTARLFSVASHELTQKSVKSSKSPGAAPAVPEYATGFESGMSRLVDGWDTRERELAALHYVLDLPVSASAKILNVSPGAIQAQIELFRKRFAILPAGRNIDTPETVRVQTPGAPVMTAVEQRAADYLDQRWPAPSLSEEEIEIIASEIVEQAAVQLGFMARPGNLRRAILITIGLGVCMLTGLALWWSKDALSIQPGPKPPVIAAQSTEFPPTPQVAPLNRNSKTEEILERWQVSPYLWYSLTVDSQTIDYGPPSYIGPARHYRVQGWVLLPDQGIELFSLLSEPPGQVYLVGSGRAFTRSYAMNRTWSEEWSGRSSDLLTETGLRGMIFPATSPWANREGSFWWAGSQGLDGEMPDGRQAVVFDWLNHLNQREARLWLDIQSGIIIRQQVFGGEQFERLERDSLITEMAFGRREPPPALIVAARQSRQIVAATPGFQIVQATPTAAIAATPLSLLPTEAVPPGMDTSMSRLTFQFATEPSAANVYIYTADVPASLFADGYYLGEMYFGLPWVLRCDRSPDGKRLAFNTGSDGASIPDPELRWFNLSNPQQIYRPMRGFDAVEFAFSPDGAILAAAGAGEALSADHNLPPGIYLISIATGEYSHLIEVDHVSSLVWSPDGEFLAFMGRLPGEQHTVDLAVHVRTGQVAYHGNPDTLKGIEPRGLIEEWEIEFPVQMGGMQTCAIP